MLDLRPKGQSCYLLHLVLFAASNLKSPPTPTQLPKHEIACIVGFSLGTPTSYQAILLPLKHVWVTTTYLVLKVTIPP